MKRIKRWLRLQEIRIRTLTAYQLRDWRTIPIHENGERLVQLPSDMCHPYYMREMELAADDRIFVRKQILQRLLMAHKLLSADGFDMKVYDGWRSVTLQGNLFWHYLKKFTAKQFQLEEYFSSAETPEAIRLYCERLAKTTQEMLLATNRIYVSWPSINPENPSPHTTGGAVDVWPFKNGKPVDLGVPFDWMEKEAGTFYHFKLWRKRFSGDDSAICQHRELLLLAMAEAGFSAYGPEIWHYNFGNQMDAAVKGETASYSYVEP